MAVICLQGALDAAALTVGGALAGNTTWHLSDSPVLVTSNVTIPKGVTLAIEAGATVKLGANISIQAQAGGTLDVEGTSVQPVTFSPQSANTKWGTLSGSGDNANVILRHAELTAGGVNLGNQATGLIEDCYIHDVTSAIVGNSAKFVTMRRNHIRNYSETIFNSGTIILAEDSLYENMTEPNSDALEIQGGPPGSIIRRCTFRHSKGSNSDAVDFNGTSGVVVQDCFIYDFSDKGISMGASGSGGQPDHGIVITNCSISNTSIGVAVKDGTTCSLYQTTIANCVSGLRLYQKFTTPADGGHITNGWNNIFWGNQTTIDASANSSIALEFSTFEATNWPGEGNLTNNPLFLNASLRDYRLGQTSPARLGKNGMTMGPIFPVGAAMALSQPRIESIANAGDGTAILSFWADPEASYSLWSTDSLNAGTWTNVAAVSPPPLPKLTSITNTIDRPAQFFQLAR
jgi:hypothetical protein